MTSPAALTITELDASDDAAYAAWHAAYWQAQRHGLGTRASAWTATELRVALTAPDRRRRRWAYAGTLDGHVVSTGYLATPLLDNRDSAQVAVDVVPDLRRRGLGTRMLAHVEQEARAQGRTLLDAEAAWPDEHGPTGAGWPGVDFATGHGYALGLGDVQRELAVPVSDALLADLAAQAAVHHPAYSLRTWVGPVPEDLLVGWTALSASLATEAPTGEREVEEETADTDAVRELEATLVKQGRVRFHAVALDAAGEVAAYTDLVTSVHDAGRAYQWGTLVRRRDRGHRLGTAVKVANQQQLQRERSDITRVTTFNAEVNRHMIEVNEQLGFVAVARFGQFQKRLS